MGKQPHGQDGNAVSGSEDGGLMRRRGRFRQNMQIPARNDAADQIHEKSEDQRPGGIRTQYGRNHTENMQNENERDHLAQKPGNAPQQDRIDANARSLQQVSCDHGTQIRQLCRDLRQQMVLPGKPCHGSQQKAQGNQNCALYVRSSEFFLFLIRSLHDLKFTPVSGWQHSPGSLNPVKK